MDDYSSEDEYRRENGGRGSRAAKRNASTEKYDIIQVNGCRINRAVGWTDPEPPKSCELYIKNIPRKFKGEDLWPLFERYGKIYSVRLLMDYNDMNRGFGFVIFAEKTDALVCMEFLNHCFILPGHKLTINPSTDKSRLFANHLPKHVPRKEIQEKFQEIFPEMKDFDMPGPVIGAGTVEELHRGFAFLEFSTHNDAIAAKKKVYSGILEIWDTPIKINWAKPELNDDDDFDTQHRRLFIRPLGGSCYKACLAFLGQFTESEKIIKLELKKGQVGILKMLTQKDAEDLIPKLNDQEFEGNKLFVTWYRERNTDNKRYSMCKALELGCIANFWTKPVMIFGRVFPERNQQYAACYTTYGGMVYPIFCKFTLHTNMNIVSRMAEVYLALIESGGYIQPYSYCISVLMSEAKVVGFIKDLRAGTFIRTNKSKETNFCFYWSEMLELSYAVHKLASLDQTQLHIHYKKAAERPTKVAKDQNMFFLDDITTNNRQFACVYDDKSDITILLLCDKVTKSNYEYLNEPPIPYSASKATMCYGKHPQSLQLTELEWDKKQQD